MKTRSKLLWFLRTYYLRHHPVHCVVTTLTSFLLGIISAVFAAAIGPSIYSLTLTASDATISLSELLGSNLAPVAIGVFGVEEINARSLTLYLPLAILAFGALRVVLMIGHNFMWERCGELVSLRLRAQLVELFLGLNPQQRYVHKKKSYALQKKIWPRLSPPMYA